MTRSIPESEYRDHRQYRDLLRQDFQFRCAYCLTQEFFLGGEAGCEIDHHHPLHGPHGRPDLEAIYSNLYWSCAECNSNKGDTWPDEEEYEQGHRFIDPCEAWGDHDNHWRFHPDGRLEALTPEGRYTERNLMLWREFLVDRRRQMFQDQEDAVTIRTMLGRKRLSTHRRAELERHLADILRRLEPPLFDRPRRPR
ncbi:MAG TPA: HNH endonuclease [Chthonomonadaceae bacterium]|nr:HNH endonuclease [Chthonomonadaceae bacterium]